jgi:dipeptidyl aminopeptidase/acylaminoacyl peptidase
VLPLALVALACACSLADDAPSAANAQQTRPALAELAPARVVAAGEAGSLVTPRWRPDGRGIVASGHLGRGLYDVDLREGIAREVARDIVAGRSLVFRPDGRAVAVPAADDGTIEVALDNGREVRFVSRPAYVPAPERLSDGRSDAVVLWRGRHERVLFEPLRGRVARVTASGEEVVAEEGAWGVAPSPDGSRIAYCIGHLTDGHLFVHEREIGTRDLGPGVHASWLPDGRYIVFAVPEVAQDRVDEASLVGAELFLVDVETGRDVQLTATGDVTEMEPAVSPDGSEVAYADWRSGSLHVAWLTVAAPEGRLP